MFAQHSGINYEKPFKNVRLFKTVCPRHPHGRPAPCHTRGWPAPHHLRSAHAWTAGDAHAWTAGYVHAWTAGDANA